MEEVATDYWMLVKCFWNEATSMEVGCYICSIVMSILIMFLAMKLFQLTDNLYSIIGKNNNRLARLTLVALMITAFFHGLQIHAPNKVELMFMFAFMIGMFELNILALKIIKRGEEVEDMIEDLTEQKAK